MSAKKNFSNSNKSHPRGTAVFEGCQKSHSNKINDDWGMINKNKAGPLLT